MKTHILISIEEIKNRLTEHEESMDLEAMLVNYKQISLNEEDIEAEANLLYSEPNANDSLQSVYKWSGKLEGYKQALKDLL